MKKKILSFCVFCLMCVSILLSCFLPCGSKLAKAKDSSSEEEIQQTLISSNITNNDWVNTYGGKSTEVSVFTPFDYEAGHRLSGKSIVPEADENSQLINKSYNLLENGGIGSEIALSLGIWVYFSDISLHSLSLKLTIDEENYITFNLSKDQLIDLVKKGDGINEQAFAWNYIEFPLTSGSVVGNIYHDNKLKEFKTITFDYKSNEIYPNSTFAKLRFYGLNLQSSTQNIISATEKQDYTTYSFNFWGENITENIVKGDTYKTPYLQTAVNYAWVGEVNLLNNENLISWQIVLTTPDGKIENYNFGENITFAENGVYLLTYKAESKSDAFVVNLYDYIEIYVRKNNFAYFDFSNYEVKTGETCNIKLNLDTVLDVSSIEILSTTIGNESLAKIEKVENNVYSVKGLKSGNTNLTIRIKAKRNNSSDEQEYQAITTIIVKKGKDSNKGIMTFLWIALGVMGAIGIVLLIRIIVLSRKNNVK